MPLQYISINYFQNNIALIFIIAMSNIHTMNKKYKTKIPNILNEGIVSHILHLLKKKDHSSFAVLSKLMIISLYMYVCTLKHLKSLKKLLCISIFLINFYLHMVYLGFCYLFNLHKIIVMESSNTSFENITLNSSISSKNNKYIFVQAFLM